jgi:hypothetical protein
MLGRTNITQTSPVVVKNVGIRCSVFKSHFFHTVPSSLQAHGMNEIVRFHMNAGPVLRALSPT